MSIIPADELKVGETYIGLMNGSSPSTKKALLDFKIKYKGNSSTTKGWKEFTVGNTNSKILRNPEATNFYLASNPPVFTNENQKELNRIEEGKRKREEERIQKLSVNQIEQEKRYKKQIEERNKQKKVEEEELARKTLIKEQRKEAEEQEKKAYEEEERKRQTYFSNQSSIFKNMDDVRKKITCIGKRVTITNIRNGETQGNGTIASAVVYLDKPIYGWDYKIEEVRVGGKEHIGEIYLDDTYDFLPTTEEIKKLETTHSENCGIGQKVVIGRKIKDKSFGRFDDIYTMRTGKIVSLFVDLDYALNLPRGIGGGKEVRVGGSGDNFTFVVLQDGGKRKTRKFKKHDKRRGHSGKTKKTRKH